MLSVFSYAFNAIFPIILLIILGYYLKKAGFLTDEFLSVGNKFMFRICLPAMLFMNVYKIKSFSEIKWDVIVFSVAVIGLLFILGLVAVRFLIPDKKQKGVVLQCAFRSNFAIIGTVLAQGLGGEKAAIIVGILSAFTISLFNVLAVISLTVFTGSEKLSFKKIVRGIVTNPLIIGIALGFAALVLRRFTGGFTIQKNLPFLFSAVKSLANIASPLALVVLGGKFTFEACSGMKKQIITGTLMRNIIAPGIALSLGVILTKLGIVDFGKSEYPALIALFATPVAVSSAIMAGEMKNDEILAAQLVVWTSVLSMISVFGFVVVFRTIGLL